MLKRLELVGFKSFADKTRFDFAPGITAIVGPNGSGKSNVVDAVKWILGEQSAKSLRGGEMADVIFNGSSTRKSLGLAEVTMTFDNTRRQLRFDSDEVQITRRVYRDGQGEYLINAEMSRLKDIKELFLGSGAGQGAYSIIEQGRVDALLTASASDRRSIFEEAAGISRFKAKKLETLRKLEHTEQNLNRVKDILQELEKNLRVLSAQAAKAQKYQEYHAQLRELRLSQSTKEYRSLSATLATEDAALAAVRLLLADVTARTTGGEQSLQQLETELTRADDGLRHQEKRLSEAKQKIAEFEAQTRSAREQALSLEAELLRVARQRSDVSRRLRTLESDSARAKEGIESVAKLLGEETSRAEIALSALNQVSAQIAELTQQAAEYRKTQFQLVADAARLHSTAERESLEVDRLSKELARKASERNRTSAEADSLARILADLSDSDAGLQQRLQLARQSLQDLLQLQGEYRHQADALQPALEEGRERRSALRGQADVLESLERNLEGIGAGVRALLKLSTTGKSPDAMLGMVADLLTVPREVAPIIDIALGDIAQRFVVRSSDEMMPLLAELGTLPGRVGFLPLDGDANQPAVALEAANIPSVTPAWTLVRSIYPELPRRLLGNLLVVEQLETARMVALRLPGYRVVTQTGELLEADGSLVVGPAHAEIGLLSRKSELRELREQTELLDREITNLEQKQGELRALADGLQKSITDRETEIQTLSGEAGALRDRIVQQREKRDRLSEYVELITRESAITTQELERAQLALREATTHAATIDHDAELLKRHLESTDQQIREAEQTRVQRQEESTEAQVALGRVKQQLAGLRTRGQELEEELKRRRFDLFNFTADERSVRERLTLADLAGLRSTQSAAEAYREKEARQLLAVEWLERRSAIARERDRIRSELSSVRENWEQQHEQAHAHELIIRDLTTRRDALVQRVREDFSVELATIAEGASPGDENESEVDAHQEIEELKRKLARLGSVNLEALEQLSKEEAREKQIRDEYDDLTTAEQSLLEIIEQINTDSKKMFNETLTTVRGHFQELFRKLFGGGMADIILENPEDVLESGIEITARPPGKELRSISLLSGGEKTLTAVALLLAIFRSKPSPFCLLDEVDAALDEANTGRLADVLRDFLDRSQFIVITHKKRTMAMADVLYGITMQESGISKQVATRLEDWPDEPPQPQQAA